MNSKTRSIVLSVALLTITAAGSYAQSFHFGVKAGANILKLGGRSFDNKFQFGYSAGGFAELNLNNTWGLQVELLANQATAKTSADFNQIYPGQGISYQNVSLNYITLPVMVNFRPVKEFSILAGAQYGYMVYQTKNLVQGGKDVFNKNDVSIVFGGQFNLNKFKLGARYIAGLNDLHSSNLDSGVDPWKNNGFQLYLGYRIL